MDGSVVLQKEFAFVFLIAKLKKNGSPFCPILTTVCI